MSEAIEQYFEHIEKTKEIMFQLCGIPSSVLYTDGLYLYCRTETQELKDGEYYLGIKVVN